jgi:hypothetical protein
MKPVTARIAGVASLTLLANLFFASTAHVAEPKAGPHESVRIKRAPKQPESPLFAALQLNSADLSRPTESEKRSACVERRRIGPRDTIVLCR